MEEEFDNIVKLKDENGTELEFEFLDLIEYEGGEYIVLLPVDDSDTTVTILKVESLNDDEEQYVGVEDENVLRAVYEIFKEKFKDDFDFND